MILAIQSWHADLVDMVSIAVALFRLSFAAYLYHHSNPFLFLFLVFVDLYAENYWWQWEAICVNIDVMFLKH